MVTLLFFSNLDNRQRTKRMRWISDNYEEMDDGKASFLPFDLFVRIAFLDFEFGKTLL